MYKQNYSDVFMINTFIMNITLLEIFFQLAAKTKLYYMKFLFIFLHETSMELFKTFHHFFKFIHRG